MQGQGAPPAGRHCLTIARPTEIGTQSKSFGQSEFDTHSVPQNFPSGPYSMHRYFLPPAP